MTEADIQPMPRTTIDDLAAAASREEWDFVDAHLGTIADDPNSIEWAQRNLEDDDPQRRDLAASVFEASSVTPSDEVRQALHARMLVDSNPYARYRSAFALFRHGDRSSTVIDVIHGAYDDEKDADAKDIARTYLLQLAAEQRAQQAD